MKQFEADLIDALALDLLTTIIVVKLTEHFQEHPNELDERWQLSSRYDVSAIRHIIDAVNVPTLREFFANATGKRFQPHMSRTFFILCVTAFDSFLERHGAGGTLGSKFIWLKKGFEISQQLEDDLCEIVVRRNDVAHNNGFVSTKYTLPTGLYTGLTKCSWITRNGTPGVGEEHIFNADYQFWMLDRVWRTAEIVCGQSG